MEQKITLDRNLIVRMLREFVVEHSGTWVHPDLCDKAADTIEALMAENEQLRSPSPNKPLSPASLRKMAKKPYWHVGLRPESEPPHWAILPENVAKNPRDYHYGRDWLAYRQETEDEVKKEAGKNADSDD